MKLLKFKSGQPSVEFCDSCASVCGERCRASRAREAAIDRAVAARFGG